MPLKDTTGDVEVMTSMSPVLVIRKNDTSLVAQ